MRPALMVWMLLFVAATAQAVEPAPLPPLTFTVALYEFEVADPVRRAAFTKRLGEMNHDLVADLLDGSAVGWLVVRRPFVAKLTAENRYTVDQRLPSYVMTPGLPTLEPGRPIGFAARISAIKPQADGYVSIQIAFDAAIADPGAAIVGGQVILPALRATVEETEMRTSLMLKRGSTVVAGNTMTGSAGEYSRMFAVTLE
jgi:hypothetical protein